MEKDKKKATPEINEEMMMNLMVEGVKKDGLQFQPEASKGLEKQSINVEIKKDESATSKLQKTRNHKKKGSDSSYGDYFLTNHSMKKRGDKSIYIRGEYHERLSRIIQVIGKDEIPLYAYLDNILQHHFEIFEKAITDDFNEKFKPIF